MRVRHPSRFVAGFLILAFAIGQGCKNEGSSGASGEVLIGHYASLTGNQATFGESTDNGVKLAIEEHAATPEGAARKVKLLTYDDKGDAREASSAVQRFITRDKVVAVIGEVASGLSLAAGPVCQSNQVPMVSPSSTNPEVTAIGDMIFRVCFIDPFQARVCARFAREHERTKASKAAILFAQDSPYSADLAEWFEKDFTSLGGTITSKQSFIQGDQDFSAQLTSIRGTDPEIIFIPAYYTDVGNIAVQARRLDITVPLLGSDGWDSDKLPEIAGKSIEGCFYSNHYSAEDPNPRVQEFIKKYKDKFGGTPDGLAALGYDAARILLEAFARCQTLDGPSIAKELAATKEFQGVTGTITIDADRNAVKPAVIIEIKDGLRKYVTTYQPEK
jgi:branched-chain amino acid transport system substrate-binding protein